MNHDQAESLYGPTASHSEHKEGTVITFRSGSQVKQGKILHVRAPGQAPVSGKELPTLYIVDTGEGIPAAIAPSMIIEGSFPVILASYGFKDHSLSSREEAENLAANVEGQIITLQDERRLKVLSACIEGDEKAGEVMAECEAVGDEIEEEQKGE
jgi:hypothetical protein